MSACAHDYPFRFHRTMAQVMADEAHGRPAPVYRGVITDSQLDIDGDAAAQVEMLGDVR